MNLQTLHDREQWQGTRVLLRSSLNISLTETAALRDRFRFERALPTLTFLTEAGAKVVLMAHIGRGEQDTLKPIYDELQKHVTVYWTGGLSVGEIAAQVDSLKNGDVLLLENLRRDPREAKNDDTLAAWLATLGDVYVNDAFANIHREHASMVGVARYLPAYAGLNLAAEVAALESVMQPAHPAILLLGGAKFATKQPLVEAYLDTYDHLFIGGALANDFYKAKGYEVGNSLLGDPSQIPDALLEHEKIILPSDVVVETPAGSVRTCAATAVQPGEAILDAGPQTITELTPQINAAATILWNGPLGNYEQGYADATEALAKVVARAAGHAVVGGGDTVAAIQKLGLNEQFGFVSTGGGAMLTFLEQGTTPALEALRADA